MSIATYTDLLAAVQNYLFGRTDIAQRIPEWVTLVEAKLNRLLYCRQMEGRSFTLCQPQSSTPEWLTLPFNFQTLRRIRIVGLGAQSPTGTSPRLRFATQAQIDDLRCTNPPVGQPIWFALFGSEIEMVPTPDQAYQLEIVYRSVLPPLNGTDDNGANIATNWLLTSYPDAYLYGLLLEASPYLYDDARIPT